jgi:hypothetical protein
LLAVGGKAGVNSVHAMLIKVGLKCRKCDDTHMFFDFRNVFLTRGTASVCCQETQSAESVKSSKLK